jgi:2-oxoglutarate dehydrogenase E2 component (dihydrolipoamide succinyltransferase)
VFLEKHGVKLGFMSAFVKAAADGLQLLPAVNAVIDGDEIIYRDYYDISIAVATPKGLVVPVLRNADKLSFAGVERVRGGPHSMWLREEQWPRLTVCHGRDEERLL